MAGTIRFALKELCERSALRCAGMRAGETEAMKESAFTSKLLHALRAHSALREAVIWKLNDRFTRGIPDFVVVTSEGRATWWEVKIHPNYPTKIQAYFLNRLRFSWCIYAHARSGGVKIPPAASIFTFDEAVEEVVRRCIYKDTTGVIGKAYGFEAVNA